jgi:hypothetical protein
LNNTEVTNCLKPESTNAATGGHEMQSLLCRLALLALPLGIGVFAPTVSAGDEESDLIYNLPPVEVASTPKYTELLDWVADVRRDGFALIKVSRQNGFFIAVFKTREGDVAFCKRPIDTDPKSSSFDIVGPDGNSAIDLKRKTSVRALRRTFIVRAGTAKATIAVVDGSVYSLVADHSKKMRIRFAVSKVQVGEEKPNQAIYADVVIFDEEVEWP